MKKSKVALIRCETYEDETVLEAIRRGLELLGGVSMFAKLGERIVLKPNVLIGSNPDNCVTTHPAVLKAVGRLFQEAGAIVSYGDSPAFGKCEFNLKRAGLKQVGDEMGLVVADFDSGRAVSHKEALLIKNFAIANGVLDADGLINLPKFKAHPLVRFTGAIKNNFGCIPGLRKSQFHSKLPDPYDFATMLVDLNTLIKPRLCIMDGIMAMEGNGPRSGDPKKMNVLLLSSDPIAVDATACRIIDLDPAIVPTSQPGEKSGLGTYQAENIEIVGDSIDQFIDRTFDVIRRPPAHCTTGRIRSYIRNQTCERPVIDAAKCTNCGTCVEMCPEVPKSVDWHTGDISKQPTYKYERCIRCFCCQETCPEGAISIRNPLLGKIMSRI
jgi:uncharacterized protein (DUF362 family)/Pyruvate/2-oxoacid:ferredoxin oxidoreductase delta subunit